MKNILLFIFAVGILTSCTRKSNEDGTSVRMRLDPSLSFTGQQSKITVPSGYYPMHMVVNLHYDGKIAKEEWDCDARDSSDMLLSDCKFPTYIDFKGQQFPRGSGRVVQVMLVFANQEERLIFGYDDALGIDFAGPEVSVDIGSNWVRQGGGRVGKVAGRHGSLKTGRLEGYFMPPREGRPRMKIFDEFMYSGWFEVMLFEDVKMSYYQKPIVGETPEYPLFVNKNIPEIASSLKSTSAAVMYNVPTYYGVRSWMNEDSNLEFESELRGGESYIIGFFDELGNPRANSSSFSINKRITATSLSGLFRKFNATGTALMNPLNSAMDSFVNPNGNGANVDESEWDPYKLQYVAGVNSSAINEMSQVFGMSSSVATACTGADTNNLVTGKCIVVEPILMAERGLIPFKGPFQATLETDGRVSFIRNTGPNELKWKYLPGTSGNSIHGTAIFIVDDFIDFDDERAPCAEMAVKANIANLGQQVESQSPFALYMHALVPAATGAVEGVHAFPVAAELGGKQAMVCPWTDVGGKKYFSNFGMNNHGFYYGVGPGPSQPTKVKMEILGGASKLNQNTCTAIDLVSVDDMNIERASQFPLNVDSFTFFDSLSGGLTQIFDSNDCDVSISSAIIPANNSRLTVYVKTTVASGSGRIRPNATNFTSVEINISAISNNITAFTPGNSVKLLSELNHVKYNCKTLDFISVDSNGVPAKPSSGGILYNVDSTDPNNVFYNSHHDCISEIGGLSGLVPVSSSTGFKSHQRFWVKTIAGSPTSFQFRANDGGVVDIYGFKVYNLVEPGPAVRTMTYIKENDWDSGIFRTGFCYEVDIEARDSQGYITKAPVGGLDFTLDSPDSGIKFSENSDCITALNFNLNSSISPYGFKKTVYGKIIQPNYSINVSNNINSFEEIFMGPVADQTRLMFTGLIAVMNNCNQNAEDFYVKIVDSSMSIISSIVDKPFVTPIIIQSAYFDGDVFLSSTPATCADNLGGAAARNINAYLDYTEFYFKTNASGSTNLTVTAEGMMMDTRVISW